MMNEQSKNQNFCGFLVVRLPEHNILELVNELGQVVNPIYPPRLDSVHYGGIHRQPWADIAIDYHTKKLPEDIKAIYKKILDNNCDVTGIDVCTDLEDAQKLLIYSNKLIKRNEIIALYSQPIRSSKQIEPNIPLKTSFLGFDLVALGAFSLLADGLFKRPEIFGQWCDLVNPNGLFSSVDDLSTFAELYLKVAETNIVEPLPFVSIIEPIEIHALI